MNLKELHCTSKGSLKATKTNININIIIVGRWPGIQTFVIVQKISQASELTVTKVHMDLTHKSPMAALSFFKLWEQKTLKLSNIKLKRSKRTPKKLTESHWAHLKSFKILVQAFKVLQNVWSSASFPGNPCKNTREKPRKNKSISNWGLGCLFPGNGFWRFYNHGILKSAGKMRL